MPFWFRCNLLLSRYEPAIIFVYSKSHTFSDFHISLRHIFAAFPFMLRLFPWETILKTITSIFKLLHISPSSMTSDEILLAFCCRKKIVCLRDCLFIWLIYFWSWWNIMLHRSYRCTRKTETCWSDDNFDLLSW